MVKKIFEILRSICAVACSLLILIVISVLIDRSGIVHHTDDDFFKVKTACVEASEKTRIELLKQETKIQVIMLPASDPLKSSQYGLTNGIG
jgi:hypothetical protein